jgi:hypothetical protein
MVNTQMTPNILKSLYKTIGLIINNHIDLVLFSAFLIWFYKIPPWMWNQYIPEHGDALEALWQINLWREAVLRGDYSFVDVSAMYPLGLHHATIAHFGVGFLSLPISIITNSMFATNFIYLASLIICFLGSRFFISQITQNKLLAGIGSIIFTFALGRTVHIFVHWNVSLASALSVWMAGLLLRLRHTSAARRHALAIGLLWGTAVIVQPYSLFHNALLLLLLGKQKNKWSYIPIICFTALIICAPFLFLNWLGSNYSSSIGPSLTEVTGFQSSLTSYLGWGALSHWQLLKNLTLSWRPVLEAQNNQNWGVLTIILTSAGIVTVIKTRTHKAILVLLLTCFLLSLGPVWRIPLSKLHVIQTLNDSIWQLGSMLKPSLFDAHSHDLKDEGVPSPVMVAYLLIPRFEYARVPGRYAIWVGLAALALSLLALRRLPATVSTILACIWLLELLPRPLIPRPVPVVAHPAHQWAAAQLAGQQDRGVYSPSSIRSVYSQYLAGKLPSTSTFGSFAPGYTRYTYPWILFSHYLYDPPEIALTEPAYARVLRRAQVSIVLLRPRAAELAKRNSALRFIRCFKPEEAKSYLPISLCAFEVLEGNDDFFNIQPLSGFSYFEPSLDFIWVEGTHAQAGWRITKPVTHTIALTLRAYCPYGHQTVRLRLNERPLVAHTWSGNCWEPWSTTLVISPEHLKAGLNRLEFEADSAAQPSLHDPNSQDQRRLSVGVELLRVIPVQSKPESDRTS